MADLLRAAEHLFVQKGYDATTMSGIASLAGASVGSLYQFFPNKESVGSALLLGYTDALSGQMDQWKATLPPTPRQFGQELISIVFDYVSHRPAFTVLAQTPSLVPESSRMEKFSMSIQYLLATYAPSFSDEELAMIALTASLMVRGAIQGSRMVDTRKGVTLRRELQEALAVYLETRLGASAA